MKKTGCAARNGIAALVSFALVAGMSPATALALDSEEEADGRADEHRAVLDMDAQDAQAEEAKNLGDYDVTVKLNASEFEYQVDTVQKPEVEAVFCGMYDPEENTYCDDRLDPADYTAEIVAAPDDEADADECEPVECGEYFVRITGQNDWTGTFYESFRIVEALESVDGEDAEGVTDAEGAGDAESDEPIEAEADEIDGEEAFVSEDAIPTDEAASMVDDAGAELEDESEPGETPTAPKAPSAQQTVQTPEAADEASATPLSLSMDAQDHEYTGKYYTKYAVVKSDGFIYRADESGDSIGDIWGDDWVDAEETLDKVEILYIDADVTSLNSTSLRCYDWIHSTFAINLGDDLYGLKKIVFKLDANGRSSVQSMPSKVFSDHKFLDEVRNFDKTQIAEIPDWAFSNCTRLTSISIPSTVKEIEYKAFYNCEVMERITIPASSSLLWIGSYAFENCYHLGSDGRAFEMPEALMQIDGGAFKNCHSLTKIILWNGDSTVKIGGGLFNDSAVTRVYVHNRFMDDYLNSSSTKDWSYCRNLLHGFLEVESVPDVLYTGADQEPEPSVTWLGEPLDAENYEVAYANNVNAGTATVTVTGLGGYAREVSASGNIYVCSDTAEFTIARAMVDAPVAATGLVYTGGVQCGVADGEGFSVECGLGTDAGNYTAIAKLDENYMWTDETTMDKDIAWSIAKAPSSIEIEDTICTYTGWPAKYSGDVIKNGSKGAVTYAYYSDAACTRAVAPRDAGIYYVKATLAADRNFESAKSNPATLTILKANNTFSFAPVKSKFTVAYGKKTVINPARAFKVTRNASGGSIKYKKLSGSSKITVSSSGKITVKKGLKRGTYRVTVKATAKATANYKSASDTATFKVRVR